MTFQRMKPALFLTLATACGGSPGVSDACGDTCGDGEVCDGGQCRAQCTGDETCAKAEACREGLCREVANPECRKDIDCPLPGPCRSQAVCMAAHCKYETLQDGTVCVVDGAEGRCAAASCRATTSDCASNTDCSPLTCIAGGCAVRSTSGGACDAAPGDDADCQQDLVCHAGTCEPANAVCTSNDDCSPLTCRTGSCVEQSVAGGPCDSSPADNADCQTGLLCDAGTCRASSAIEKLTVSGPAVTGEGNGLLGIFAADERGIPDPAVIYSAGGDNVYQSTSRTVVLDQPIPAGSNFVFVSGGEDSDSTSRMFSALGEDDAVIDSLTLTGHSKEMVFTPTAPGGQTFPLFHFDGLHLTSASITSNPVVQIVLSNEVTTGDGETDNSYGWVRVDPPDRQLAQVSDPVPGYIHETTTWTATVTLPVHLGQRLAIFSQEGASAAARSLTFYGPGGLLLGTVSLESMALNDLVLSTDPYVDVDKYIEFINAGESIEINRVGF